MPAPCLHHAIGSSPAWLTPYLAFPPHISAAPPRAEYPQVRDRLDHGADVQMSDSTGATALLTSVKYGDSHKSITSLLLQRGALTDTTPAYLVELVKMADRNQNMDTITLLEQCAHRHC